jgi:hypothetical protein
VVDLSGILEIQTFLRDNVLTPVTFASAAELRAKHSSFMRGGEIVSVIATNPLQYVWVPLDLSTDDGISVIKPSDLAAGDIGRWRLMARQTLFGTKTWDPGTLAADGNATSTTVTVTGAVVGDPAFASLTTIGANNVLVSAHVSSADTVTVVVMNKTGGALDIASGTLNVVVHKA